MNFKKLYDRMSDKDAFFIFALLGGFFMVFGYIGLDLNCMDEFASLCMFISGCFVGFMVLLILFYKNDFFLHDLNDNDESDKLKD